AARRTRCDDLSLPPSASRGQSGASAQAGHRDARGPDRPGGRRFRGCARSGGRSGPPGVARSGGGMSLFEKLGQVGGMLRNLPKLKEELERTQQRLGQLTAEGDAGAGMVKVRVSGRMEVLGCSLSEDAMKLNDREMLED